jgi:hypothetical protein
MVVIGADLMQSLAYVRFDLFTRTISYATDLPYRSNKLYKLAELPFKLTPQGIAVEAMFDGKPQTLIIDTGGDYEVAMFLDDNATPLIRRLVIGDFARVSVPVNDAEFLGLGVRAPTSAGIRLFDGLILTLDFENSQFILETPTPPVLEP